MKPSLLYKVHENEDCDTLQSIVRYAFVIHNMDIRPISIMERCMPNNITKLPTIMLINGCKLEGLNEIVNHYEKLMNVTNLIEKSNLFNKLNPNYRITDNSTHKKIILS